MVPLSLFCFSICLKCMGKCWVPLFVTWHFHRSFPRQWGQDLVAGAERKPLIVFLPWDYTSGNCHSMGQRFSCDTFFKFVPFFCYSNLRPFPFLSFAIQIKPPPSAVTQRNKQPWHPDEDDEEFTANEEEGQGCSVCPIAPYPLNELSGPNLSGFLICFIWTVSCASSLYPY